MEYSYLFVLLLYLINNVAAELSLEIFKKVNGTEVPVNDTLHELAGSDLTLTCKLVALGNDVLQYFDNELSWGRQRKNVQFDNVTDLKKLAEDSSKPLYQFINKMPHNEAVMRFHQVFPVESGKYFCMSLKYNLFNIVEIKVNVGSGDADLAMYFKAMDSSRSDFMFELHKAMGFTMFMCIRKHFICNSRRKCYDETHVCDGIKDCDDGSDENIYLCGTYPCAGKKSCSDGRCIAYSLCCNKFQDPYCTVDVKPSCCFERKEKYFDKNKLPITPQQNDDFDFSNKLNNHEVEAEDIWRNSKEESQRMESLWVVVPCIVILIMVIICIMIRQSCVKPTNRNRSARSQHCPLAIPPSSSRDNSLVCGRTSPAPGRLPSVCSRISPVGRISQNSGHIYENYQNRGLSRSATPNYDLPPSYNEAMANSLPVYP